jgi:flagella basal body P-ring formation protein FlgA
MMTGNRKWLALTFVLLGAAGPVCEAGAWNLVLPDTVVLDHDLATLGDVAAGPVPVQTRELVIRAGLKPNGVVTVSRQDILRRLVTAGLAHGVRLTGASQSHLIFTGRELDIGEIQREVRGVVQPLVPPSNPGAPDSWFELDLPEIELAAADAWHAETDRTEFLEPGRNLVRIRVADGEREESFPAAVTLHQFGEVGRVRQNLARNKPLEETMFDWQWRDLADLDRGLAVHRTSIQGASPTRNLKAGDYLRQSDLKETPVILAGDPVELQVKRGQVVVTVRAFARQNGCLGQTIPVRNELTGRLVNARVAGPGRVEWRR